MIRTVDAIGEIVSEPSHDVHFVFTRPIRRLPGRFRTGGRSRALGNAVGMRLATAFDMPALTGQCKRCSRYGELFPVRGIYYCRPCGELFDRHLRGYRGPDRRTQSGDVGPRRRWSDVKAADPFLALRSI